MRRVVGWTWWALAISACGVVAGCGVPVGAVAGLSGRASLRAEFRIAPCPSELEGGAIARVGSGAAGLAGRLVLPGAGLPLGRAEVTLEDAAGRPLAAARTDGCGRYRFEALAEGDYRVRYRLRSLRGAVAVRVGFGGAEDVRPVDTSALRVAVFRGKYDHVERILDDMGIYYELLPPERLVSADLARYDIVFINCTAMALAPLPAKVAPRLRAYVDGGGALYVSDLALPYLEAAWPERIVPSKAVTLPSIQLARAAAPDLHAYLRWADVLPLVHDLPGWKRIASVDASVEALVVNGDSGEPHMVTFASGEGVVGYTTFHHEAQLNDAMLYSLVFLITRL